MRRSRELRSVFVVTVDAGHVQVGGQAFGWVAKLARVPGRVCWAFWAGWVRGIGFVCRLRAVLIDAGCDRMMGDWHYLLYSCDTGY